MSGVRSLQERASVRVGATVKDKWRLDALLGVGGTAAVYAATHRNGKRAAIKMLHAELASNGELVTRFLREGYVANKIGHEGAVSVLDDDRADDGSVFLVMELLDGYSLDRHTRPDSERLSAQEVLRIGDAILDVLSAAHGKGIVHRDIKPANVFLTRERKVKVLDFGIARLAELQGNDATATQTGAAIGTPAFMPPEQARGRWNLVDARTDVWAVGATLFALLTGQRPRKAETVNEELLLAMTQPVPSIATLAPQLPRPIVEVVDRALAFEIDHRWPDARAMQLALRQASDAAHGMLVGQPLTPNLDTAPVIQPGAGATVAMPLTPVPPSRMQPMPPIVEPVDAALTTSRPLIYGGAATPGAQPPAPSRGVPLGLAVVAMVAAVALLGIAVFVVRRSAATAGAGGQETTVVTATTTTGATTATQAPPAVDVPSTTATTTVTATPPSTGAAASTGVAADAKVTAGSATTVTTTTTATAGASATATSHARTGPTTRPTASAKPSGSADLFDQRF